MSSETSFTVEKDFRYRIKTEATKTARFSMNQKMDRLTDNQKQFISPLRLQRWWEGDKVGAITAVSLLYFT